MPSDVITVWIALDDMEPALGPLQYIHDSHRWSDGRVGSAQLFFDARDRFALLHDAARREGIEEPASALRITTLGVQAGGCGIHNGRLWHGSGANQTSKPRRGLGIHFVPADAQLRQPTGSTLAHSLRPAEDAESTALSAALFPITWTPAQLVGSRAHIALRLLPTSSYSLSVEMAVLEHDQHAAAVQDFQLRTH